MSGIGFSMDQSNFQKECDIVDRSHLPFLPGIYRCNSLLPVTIPKVRAVCEDCQSITLYRISVLTTRALLA